MAEPTTLEAPSRLSQSVVWDIQRRYFESAGQKAWSKGVVPHYITTNAHIARAYARVIAAWIEDQPHLNRDEPVYVLELGAGSGKLGFLLSHELSLLVRDRQLPPICVVITDFAEANVSAWLEHPDLTAAFESGRLDCALFDADAPGPIELRHSGLVIGPEPTVNPMVAVANYVVDTLRQDAFAIDDGQLHEILVQATLPADAKVAADHPRASEHVTLTRSRATTSLPVYNDEGLDSLLERYLNVLERSEVVIPVGAIAAFRHLLALSDGRLCVMAGDKGYRNPRDLRERTLGNLVKHGSFSMMANLDAVAHVLGGASLFHDNRYTRFTIGAMSSVTGELPRFKGAFRDFVNDFGPSEYHRLFKIARQDWKDASIPLILLLLRLSNYDPTVFARWCTPLLEGAADAGSAVQHDLVFCLRRVLERTYAVSTTEDVRFIAGRILFRLERYADASAEFKRVVIATPDRRAAWFNLGLCCERTRSLDEARAAFSKAVDLDPDYDRARKALARVS
ncbi:MAG: tetratricopeptide repeat protein [Myxococcota bacterium]